MGWYTEAGGSGLWYNYFESLQEDIALYAKWHAITGDVTRAEEHYIYNQGIEASYTGFNDSGYIINQGLTDVFKYGEDANINGCGWIATYNTLKYLQIIGKYDKEIVIADIIRYYEHYALWLDGAWGTNFSGIADYLRTLNFTVTKYTDSSNFDDLIVESDASITLFITFSAAHYMALHTYEYNDEYFNAYNPGVYSHKGYAAFKSMYGVGIYDLITIDYNG